MARIKADRANWDDIEPFDSFIRYHSIINFQSKNSLGNNPAIRNLIKLFEKKDKNCFFRMAESTGSDSKYGNYLLLFFWFCAKRKTRRTTNFLSLFEKSIQISNC